MAEIVFLWLATAMPSGVNQRALVMTRRYSSLPLRRVHLQGRPVRVALALHIQDTKVTADDRAVFELKVNWTASCVGTLVLTIAKHTTSHSLYLNNAQSRSTDYHLFL